MRGRQGGKYDVRKNNCHDFVNELTRRVCISEILPSDISSLDDCDWGSTKTLSVDFDEKVGERMIEVLPTPVNEKGLQP